MKNTKNKGTVVSGINVTTECKRQTEYKQYLPQFDPLLKQFYLARVASHTPDSPLTFEDELDLAYKALAVWRRNEQIAIGIIDD